MHVSACLAGEKVDVEVGEECRSLQALREAIVEALPKLCVEGFDVCVGGRALDDDEGVVSLQDGLSLDVVPNTRGLSVLALREAGREVSEAGLLSVVDEGNVTLAKLYLDAGMPIDCVSDDRDGRTPLHISCYNGNVELATLLLDRGAALDQKDGGDATPLLLACRSENLEIVTLLLDRGAAIDAEDGKGWTPLTLMCRSGNLEIATLLLDRGTERLVQKGRGGYTPLHVACDSGHVSVATLVLDRGCAIDEKTSRGDTPLRLVCGDRYSSKVWIEDEHLKIATLLLDRGAAIDKTNWEGETPLHRACYYEHVEIVGLLLDRGSTAIAAKNSQGDTPLHVACGDRYSTTLRGGDQQFRIATLLLDRGAAIDKKNYDGETPLHRACHCEHVEIVRLLLDRGSTAITAKNSRGDTPLQVARGSVLKLLSERGHGVLRDAAPEKAKRRRIDEQ